jgi:hypothetical protein
MLDVGRCIYLSILLLATSKGSLGSVATGRRSPSLLIPAFWKYQGRYGSGAIAITIGISFQKAGGEMSLCQRAPGAGTVAVWPSVSL